MATLRRIKVENFLSLKSVDVRLGALNVLVGPNGAGKTNLLKAIAFLGDLVRYDLAPAIDRSGGFEAILFRGKRENLTIKFAIEAQFTPHASSATPDEYTLAFNGESRLGPIYSRHESFSFKRARGKGKRITIEGHTIEIGKSRGEKQTSLTLSSESSGLSTLRKLGEEVNASQVNDLAMLFETFRVFEIDVNAARAPSRSKEEGRLQSNASNLSAFVAHLYRNHRDIFDNIVADMRNILPGFKDLALRPLGGSGEGVVLELVEAGLEAPTSLAAASYGTIRGLALLAMLHDPAPPRLSCIEEIDHGLHPYALDLIVQRLREASQRTQLLVATHSPAFVNRLRPEELIVCERDPETGELRIPSIASETVKEMETESGLGLGELWFAGSLGGHP